MILAPRKAAPTSRRAPAPPGPMLDRLPEPADRRTRTQALDAEADPRELWDRLVALAHLVQAIRVAGLRRDLHATSFEGDHGQYLKELADEAAGLRAFGATAIIAAFDAHHVCSR